MLGTIEVRRGDLVRAIVIVGAVIAECIELPPGRFEREIDALSTAVP